MKIFKSIKIGFVYSILIALFYLVSSFIQSGTTDLSEVRDSAIMGIIFFIVGTISGVVIGIIYKIFYKLTGKEKSYKLTWLVGLISGLIISLILIVPLILLRGSGESIVTALFIIPLYAVEFIANYLIPSAPEPTRLMIGALIGYPILNCVTSLLYEFFRRREQAPQIQTEIRVI